jgi:hypothetical protein
MEQLRPKICDVHESDREGRGQECRANCRKKQFSPDTYRAAEASRHDAILLLKLHYARCDFSPDAVTEGNTTHLFEEHLPNMKPKLRKSRYEKVLREIKGIPQRLKPHYEQIT